MTRTKKTAILILSLALVFALAAAACSKKAETQAATVQTVSEFQGTVRAALGRYMYLSSAQGFDLVLPGFDAATLVGKSIAVKGNLLLDHPPVFLVDSVTSGGQTVYSRSQDFRAEDFIEMKAREAVPALAVTGFNKPEEWEGKGEGKVYGRLEKGATNAIVLSDDAGKETARIIIDSMSTYSNYYVQKLRLFDKFWFYLKVKDSVAAADRRKTKEIFHADVFDVGLY